MLAIPLQEWIILDQGEVYDVLGSFSDLTIQEGNSDMEKKITFDIFKNNMGMIILLLLFSRNEKLLKSREDEKKEHGSL